MEKKKNIYIYIDENNNQVYVAYFICCFMKDYENRCTGTTSRLGLSR